MELTDRTIAKLWEHAGGYECYVHKRGDVWLLTLEQSGRVLRETPVESPGDAIRTSQELLSTLPPAG
jgi:hypothetical protein